MFCVQKDLHVNQVFVFQTLSQSILAHSSNVLLILFVNPDLVFQLINALLSDVCKDITVRMDYAFPKLGFVV